MIKTTWNYNQDTEVYRIIFTAGAIYKHFYQNHRFLVLPYLPQKNTERLVFFPDLNFLECKDFWEIIAQFSKHYSNKKQFKIPKHLENFIKSSLKRFNLLSNSQISRLRKDWSKIEKPFLAVLNEIFELNTLHLHTIEIRPTLFGTQSSYSPPNKTGKLFIYVRTGGGIKSIGEMITSTVVRHYISLPLEFIVNLEWIKKENLSDFLLKNSRLSKFFPDFRPTLEVISEICNAKIVQESSEYLAKLGFPIRSILERNNGNIINKQNGEILHGLSSMQAKVLKLLIDKKNSICSFDDMAEILWEEKAKEKFSLYAISKIIQRTRDCLKQNEIAPELIHTQRGKGYVLYD